MRRLIKGIAVNSALALVVPLLMWCFSPGISMPKFGRLFLISAAYSNCIGVLFWLFMARIWMLSKPMRSPVLAWGFRIAACLTLTTVGTALATWLLLLAGEARVFWAFFWEGYRFALLITFCVAAVITIYETQKARLEATNLQLKQKELERERAMKLAAEATLSSLESRIHPHFLFNTINSVSSLIPEDPAKAEKLLGRMSALLRFSLDAAHTGLVPVEHEMKIVEDYLEIEKARFGERLRYELDWTRARGMVPPLSIQTLVENSVKHSIAPRRDGGRIQVLATGLPGGGMAVAVTDDGAGFLPSAMMAGHGLENLEARLKTLFAGHPGLKIAGQDGCTVSFVVPETAL